LAPRARRRRYRGSPKLRPSRSLTDSPKLIGTTRRQPLSASASTAPPARQRGPRSRRPRRAEETSSGTPIERSSSSDLGRRREVALTSGATPPARARRRGSATWVGPVRTWEIHARR
jgi:hypothetical protein